MDDRVVISNERDRRTWDWLCANADAAAIDAAFSKLAGGRKPYVSNLCKVLGLSPPESLELASPDTARLHLERFRGLLAKGRNRTENQ